MSTASFKIERVQRKLAELCYNRFLINIATNKYDILATLNLSRLQSRRGHPEALFLTNVFFISNGSTTPWGPRPPQFPRLHDHTFRHTTFGKTPLDE
jgi:hypothetical protein